MHEDIQILLHAQIPPVCALAIRSFCIKDGFAYVKDVCMGAA